MTESALAAACSDAQETGRRLMQELCVRIAEEERTGAKSQREYDLCTRIVTQVRIAGAAANLFRLGVHGSCRNYEINCDALTDADWDCIAYMMAERLPPYANVLGVPGNGVKLAERMRSYCTTGHWLVVDGVWSGETERFVRNLFHKESPVIRAVAFSCGHKPDDVIALFSAPPKRKDHA